MVRTRGATVAKFLPLFGIAVSAGGVRGLRGGSARSTVSRCASVNSMVSGIAKVPSHGKEMTKETDEQFALVKFITDKAIGPLLQKHTDPVRVALACLSIADGLVDMADHLPDDFVPMLGDTTDHATKLKTSRH
jgi:hypothetical protein